MTTLEDVRKTIEATIGNLSPAKAQELAKSLSDPGTAKEQVAKLATDMLDWSQRNRDRVREFVGREIAAQMRAIGVATQVDLDAVTKRVRALERSAGKSVSERKPGVRKPAARKAPESEPPAKKTAARRPAAGRRGDTSAPSGA